ncbi:MAG: M18 family aminopeptidase [Acidimicrobiales bacterium]
MRSPDLSVARRVATHIDASPSPYHAAERAARLLEDAGGRERRETTEWSAEPGLWFIRRGGALVAWRLSEEHGPTTGFRIVGAHTDSPNLRLKPHPERGSAGYRQLGVEVYGSALLNSWLDRDLGLSGRLAVRDGASTRMQLVRFDEPLMRVPQLAIHLDREVNDKGVKLNRQLHLSPVWGLGEARPGSLLTFVADKAEVDVADILSFDLMLHDLVPATLAGVDDEFLSAPRIDNLLSCFLAVDAITSVGAGTEHITAVCLFDHEEVGSVSSSGAASGLLGSVFERVGIDLGGSGSDSHRARADTIVLSADGAHASHPNYVDRHDPEHRIALNEGPVLKVNANQRYATDAGSAAAFVLACRRADVPMQSFVNRTDLACGTTIGPLTAGQLGVAVVDAGCAQLAMHSARELAGSADPGWFRDAMVAFLGS